MTADGFIEGAAALGAAGAAAAALVMAAPRARSRTMLAALVLAGTALGPIVADRVSDQVSAHPALTAAAAAAGIVVVAVLAALFRRHPLLLGTMLFVALPFRVPLSFGGETASLLVPLYVVIVAGAVAFAFGAARRPDPDPPKPIRRLDQVLAAVLVLYALQALYSTDLEHAVKNICFFYVPFALLYRLLRDVPWTRELLVRAFGIVVALALAFAAIGCSRSTASASSKPLRRRRSPPA